MSVNDLRLATLLDRKRKLLKYIQEVEFAIQLCKDHSTPIAREFLEGHLSGMKAELLTIDSLLEKEVG